MKLTSEETGWSGDIPVQECRRRNLQWLVKSEKSFYSFHLSLLPEF